MLTVLLVGFYIVQGAVSVICALGQMRVPSAKWGWILVSGIVNLVVGVLIFVYLPSETAWAIGGLLVGVNLMIDGGMLVAMALQTQNAGLNARQREAAVGSNQIMITNEVP